MDSIDMLIGGAGIMSFLALVAIIALSVFLYIKCLGKNAKADSWGSKFFRFDNFYVEKILHIVYMVSVVLITVSAVFMPFQAAMLAGSMWHSTFFDVVGGFFGGIISGLILFVVGQFLTRMIFEYLLIFVRMSNDTRAIRNSVAGPVDSSVPNAPAAPAGPSIFDTAASMFNEKKAQVQAAVAAKQAAAAAPSAPAVQYAPVQQAPAAPVAAPAPAQAPVVAPAPVQAPAPAPAPAPVAAPAPAPATWDCACGSTGNTGKFCGVCGSPRP